MDEVLFFKSVLPAQDSFFVVDDTSLALPPEEKITSPTKVHSNDRSFRVQQQVQLTLARRGKRTTSNGSIHLPNSSSISSPPRGGRLQNIKVNGMGFSDQSLSKDHVRRPTRRVEVSPVPSPEVPRSPMAYGTLRFGTYTFPGPRLPPRMGPLTERSYETDSFRQYGTDSFRHYALSEVPHHTRLHASTQNASCRFRQSVRQTGAPQPLLTDNTFKQAVRQTGGPQPLLTDDSFKQTVRQTGAPQPLLTDNTFKQAVRQTGAPQPLLTDNTFKQSVRQTGASQPLLTDNTFKQAVRQTGAPQPLLTDNTFKQAVRQTGAPQPLLTDNSFKQAVRQTGGPQPLLTDNTFKQAVRQTGAPQPLLTDNTFKQAVRQTGAPQPLLTDNPFMHSTPNGSPRPVDVQRETAGVRRHAGCGCCSGGQRQGGVAWLSHVRRELDGPELSRQDSNTHSLVSMEVDMATRRREAEPPIQQIHVNEVTAVRSEVKAPELTLERAMNLLAQDNEDTLTSACTFIQSQCLNSTDAKKMVFYLHGIPKLLLLLQSDSEEVQRAAAGALRNVVFQSNENKMEVKEKEGVAVILSVLKGCHDVETRRQLTGVLWNLSSHDLLKEHLSRRALPVLTSTVLVPCSGISEGENPKDELLADPDVFHNATGCLRNLSSAGPDGRKAMRECDNLIDSLIYYIRGTIADYKPDDNATENCVSILHNLSYQIEAELPQKYVSNLCESRQNLAPKAKTPGCFAHRSAKITEEMERQCPLLEEKANPCGIEWLWSAITVRMYLSLMARSVRHRTQEAALGALQNITAGNGTVTEAIAHTIVLRENGLQQVRKMLQEGESDVKRMAVSLLKNISRYRELHDEIVKQVLPEVVGMLPNSDSAAALPTEVTVSLCHVLINLSQSQSQQVKAIFNHGALPKIINISTKDNGYGPTRAGQAACILLHTMWSHTELHGAYRKAGYRKADFINARTTKAVTSSRE